MGKPNKFEEFKCPICNVNSNSRCSNCLKVAYCSKEHQKQHRKVHKNDCFPALIKTHPSLGEHLASSRDIQSSEIIFHEQPLIIGPRSNLPNFRKICLGCCGPVTGIYLCSQCKWPLCGAPCEKKPWHANFECPLFAKNQVPPAKTQDEYLYITFLRGALLKYLDPDKWQQLLQFESHANSRNTVSLTLKQSQSAFKFITKTCGLSDLDKNTVDFVYGIILVNGYGDTSTFAVKLYSKAAKISHACIPNTRTRVVPNGLDVISAVAIKAGQPLTQLYGRMLKGTHKRQELLQNVYYFSCSCPRCTDPTEFSTYFSAVKCPKKCSGNILPKNPLKLDANSKWACDSSKCGFSTTFFKSVLPALEMVTKITEMDEDCALFTEYETYIGNDVVKDGETVALAQLQFILEMENKLKRVSDLIVHRNHYTLLPLKTAIIASCHSLLQNLAKYDKNTFKKILQTYWQLTNEIYEIVNIFLPGCTSDRGILLFHLAEGIRLANLEGISCDEEPFVSKPFGELEKLQEECLKIMELEPDGDPYKEMALPYLKQFKRENAA